MSTIKNLFYEVGNFKIDIPEWLLSDQGVTALCGPSGAGKTTLIKILCGLIDCPNLVWEFKNKNLAQIPIEDRNLGLVFQDLHLFPHLSARENILFAAEARHMKKKEAREKLNQLSHHLSLDDRLDCWPENLSGGERQRVALARALISPPQFLFLDEPFAYLDATTRSQTRNFLKTILNLYQVPCLLISHDSKDVESLAKELFLIEKGRLIS